MIKIKQIMVWHYSMLKILAKGGTHQRI